MSHPGRMFDAPSDSATSGLRSGMRSDEIRRAYRLAAPFHDGAAWLLESRARRRFLELLPISDGDRVVEMGVGTGLTFEGLLRRNPSGDTVGLDLTPEMLARARRRARAAKTDRFALREADVRSVDPADLASPADAAARSDPGGRAGPVEARGGDGAFESFDLVVSTYVLDLMDREEIPDLLRTWRALLGPGGRLGLLYLAPSRRPSQKLWDVLPRLHRWALGGCRGIDPRAAVRQAGFRIVRHERIVQLTYPSELVIAEVE